MAYTTINKSSLHMNTKLYTGNGGTQAVTGVGFQPDWVWTKCRNDSHNHNIFDAVRGITKRIHSDTTASETTNAESLKSFDSDGFTMGTQTNVNQNSGTYASWNWKANGQGSSNTDGSINTTYTSANTTSGFSIIKYTGNGTNNATVGHGLGVTPTLLIGKCLGTTANWQVVGNFGSLTEGKYLILNEPSAIGTSSNVSFDASATTVKFQGGQGINISGQPHIAYCFAEKTGYSKFGSYVGNGNADGTFVYTGFKPAWIMFKRTDNTGNWYIKDNKRSGTSAGQNFGQMNPNQTQYPSADTSSVENKTSGYAMDILSNGFKTRGTDSGINASGGTYIYMAFAEAPLVGTNDVTAKAR